MDYESFFDTLLSSEAFSSSLSSNLVSLASAILTIVALWKIFEKAHQPGWAALIPFYNQFVLFKISGKKNLFWGYLGAILVYMAAVVLFAVGLVGALFSVFPGSSSYEDDAMYAILVLGVLLLVASAVALLVFRIMQCIGLVKNFGLSGGYAVGLILLSVVFYCIIAFSKDMQYVGETGANGYMPNGYAPNGQPPVYMNPYSGQSQQGYQQNPYGGQAQQGYQQNPYGGQAQQGYQQNPYSGQAQQGYQQNPYGGQAQQGYQQNPYGGQAQQGYRQNPYGGQAQQGYQQNPYGGQPQQNVQENPYTAQQDDNA